MKKHNALLATLFATVFLSAQETRRLTLEEAVALGIENSKILRIDKAKIEESTASYLEAKNRKLPDLQVSGTALALANANVDLKIMPKNPNGTTPKATSALMGQANFTWPLFAGGRIRYGIESAKYLVEAAKLNAENNKAAIAYNVSQAYNNLFKAKQVISMLEKNLASSEERDKSFLKLENNGIIARNDRLKANLQTSNIELQLLDARNNYSIANINMDLLLGLPESVLIDVDDNYLAENPLQQDANYYLQQARQNRKDLQAIEYQRKAAQIGTKAASAEKFPTVALTGGYVAAEVPKILTVTNAANIGVGIQYNLDNLWKEDTEVMKSKAREAQLNAQNSLLEDQIKLEINRDYQNARFALSRIAVYEKAAQQANENYRITNNKYENGLATITELLDADAAQVTANMNVINAKADAVLAYKKLIQTTGNTDTL